MLDVFGEQSFKKDHTAVAVRESMIEFDGNTAFVNYHPQCGFIYRFERRMCKRPGFLFGDFGRRAQLFKIVPKQSLAQPYGYRREAPCRDVECASKHCCINGFAERCRKPEKVIPSAPPCRRVYLCGVIKPHPAQLALVAEVTVQKVIYSVKIAGTLLDAE